MFYPPTAHLFDSFAHAASSDKACLIHEAAKTPIAALSYFQPQQKTQELKFIVNDTHSTPKPCNLYYFQTGKPSFLENNNDNKEQLGLQTIYNVSKNIETQSLNVNTLNKENLQKSQGNNISTWQQFKQNLWIPWQPANKEIEKYQSPDIEGFVALYSAELFGGANLSNYLLYYFLRINRTGLKSRVVTDYKGKVSIKASSMTALEKGSYAWNCAINNMRIAANNCEKYQVKVKSSSDAKDFLIESLGFMNRYKVNARNNLNSDSYKYSKGYEQHIIIETKHLLANNPHIRWHNNGADGHIFYDVPN